ncbi:hypothetical protein MMC25_004378 [Agyrium rufum]|nr:hypothetical protein [Agyrium rufum]
MPDSRDDTKWYNVNMDKYKMGVKLESSRLSRTLLYLTNLAPVLSWPFIDEITHGANSLGFETPMNASQNIPPKSDQPLPTNQAYLPQTHQALTSDHTHTRKHTTTGLSESPANHTSVVPDDHFPKHPQSKRQEERKKKNNNKKKKRIYKPSHLKPTYLSFPFRKRKQAQLSRPPSTTTYRDKFFKRGDPTSLSIEPLSQPPTNTSSPAKMPTLGTDEQRFPEVFNRTDIDRHGRKRTQEMQILVIGMMRTGTMSMRTALEKLGYPNIYHMVDVMQNPRDCDMWAEALDAKYSGVGKPYDRKDWDSLLGDFNGCIDLPAAAFMPELIAAYPNAKVIVAERDAAAWYKSVANSVKKALGSPIMWTMSKLDGTFMARFYPMVTKMSYGLFGPTGYDDPENTMRRYRAVYQETRDCMKDHPDMMLEFQLKQGWEPLCRFLDVPVPNEPFPHVNESEEFGRRMQLLFQGAMTRVAATYLPMVGGVVAAGTALWAMA